MYLRVLRVLRVLRDFVVKKIFKFIEKLKLTEQHILCFTMLSHQQSTLGKSSHEEV